MSLDIIKLMISIVTTIGEKGKGRGRKEGQGQGKERKRREEDVSKEMWREEKERESIANFCQLNTNTRKEEISAKKLPQPEWPMAIYVGAFY